MHWPSTTVYSSQGLIPFYMGFIPCEYRGLLIHHPDKVMVMATSGRGGGWAPLPMLHQRSMASQVTTGSPWGRTTPNTES